MPDGRGVRGLERLPLQSHLRRGSDFVRGTCHAHESLRRVDVMIHGWVTIHTCYSSVGASPPHS